MKFLDAVGPIAISKSVWSQLLDENEKGRSVTSFQDVSLDGIINFFDILLLCHRFIAVQSITLILGNKRLGQKLATISTMTSSIWHIHGIEKQRACDDNF